MALIVAGVYMCQRRQIRRKYGTKKGANLAPCVVVFCCLLVAFFCVVVVVPKANTGGYTMPKVIHN